MGNTKSIPNGPVYESLSPSTEQIIKYISHHVTRHHPEFDPEFIEAVAHTVVESKYTDSSFREYYTYHQAKLILETVRQLKLRQNMRFLVNMVLFKVRLKYVVGSFRARYYREPDKTNPKGGLGYQKKVAKEV